MMKPVGSLRDILKEIKSLKNDQVEKIVLTTFNVDINWFYKAIYTKYLSEVSQEKINVFFGIPCIDYINSEIPLYGVFKRFYFINPEKQGIYHPKVIYIELKNKVYCGLASANLSGSGYSFVNLELQQIFEFKKDDLSPKQLVGDMVDAMIPWLSFNIQKTQLRSDFKGFPRGFVPNEECRFLLNHSGNNLLSDFKKLNEKIRSV